MSLNITKSLIVALTPLVLASPQASAGGIVVAGAGPHAQARAGAFVARADDPSALLHNPAGFATIDGTAVAIGANFVDYDLTFQRTGRYEESGEDGAGDYEGQPYPEVRDRSDPSVGIGAFQAIPFVALSTDLGRPDWPVRFGVGLFTPQGYPSRSFPERHDVGTSDTAPGPQRYDIIEQEILAAQPSLVVAYSPIEHLQVGARLAWGFATVSGKKATWSIRNYEEWEGRDTVFTLEASDHFVPAFSVGALYRPSDSIELGAAYNSAMNIRAKGEGIGEVGEGAFEGAETIPVEDRFARCETGGTRDALKTCLDATVPQMATVGARWIWMDRGRERADVELDLRWEDWSAGAHTRILTDSKNSITMVPLNETITRRGFEDVLSVRLGGSYSVPTGPGTLTLRAGAAHDTAAAPDSWTRVDMDGKARTLLATGVAYRLGNTRIDAGGGVVLEPDVTVEPCNPPDGPSVDDPGCDGTETPVLERDRPDPLQAVVPPRRQVQSPFNAGTYRSGYVLFSLGVTSYF